MLAAFDPCLLLYPLSISLSLLCALTRPKLLSQTPSSASQDWIGANVDIRQLLIETHGLAENKGIKTSDFFDDIQIAGFAMYSKEPNIHPQSTPGCAEWSFLKLDKAFFGAA